MQEALTAIWNFFVSLLALLGLTHSAPANQAFILDNWWSIDYAKNSCSSANQWLKENRDLINQLGCDQVTSCPETMPQVGACASGSDQEVRSFSNRLVSEFASSRECTGIEVAVYSGPKQPSPTALSTLFSGPHWSLQMNFKPGSDKQPWQMTHDDGGSHTNYTEGEDDPKSMAHRVCIIINGSGAKILN